MSKCLICGKESDSYICDSCRDNTDIEKLCNDVIAYTPGVIDSPTANSLWDEIAKELEMNQKFSVVAYDLADELPSPRKEYQKIHSMSGEFATVQKAFRSDLLRIYQSMELDLVSEYEQFRIKGLVMEALYSDYRYEEAEEIASELVEMVELPWQVYYVLADFYNKTRRYDFSEQVINNVLDKFGSDPGILLKFDRVRDDLKKYREAAEKGKGEYMPRPKEDKDEYSCISINEINRG